MIKFCMLATGQSRLRCRVRLVIHEIGKYARRLAAKVQVSGPTGDSQHGSHARHWAVKVEVSGPTGDSQHACTFFAQYPVFCSHHLVFIFVEGCGLRAPLWLRAARFE